MIGTIFVAMGVLIILLTGASGRVSTPNLAVGAFLVVIGLISMIEYEETTPAKTAYAKKSGIEGKNVTIEEKTITKKVKDEVIGGGG